VWVSREAIDYIKQAQEQGLQVIFSNGTPQGKIRIFEKK
jgi:hydroxymethylpyrimidine pyrophosphatase-like HAD family hydrolase